MNIIIFFVKKIIRKNRDKFKKMSSNVTASANSLTKNMTNVKSPKFIILIIILIILAVFIYMAWSSYRSYKITSPYFIYGTLDGNQKRTIPAVKIPDPSDGQYGQEFTYCAWLFIKDTNFVQTSTTRSGDNALCTKGTGPLMKVIMNKGSNDLYQRTNSNGVQTWHYPLLSSPGVFLYPDTNKLHIRFNSFDSVYVSADVGNIPLNKWFMLTINCIGNSVDIYINNMLKKRQYVGVLKMNYGDLTINPFGGFDGYISNLRYYNRSIQSWEIDEMYQLGSNTNMVSKLTSLDQKADLSPKYYFTTGFPNSNFEGKN